MKTLKINQKLTISPALFSSIIVTDYQKDKYEVIGKDPQGVWLILATFKDRVTAELLLSKIAAGK